MPTSTRTYATAQLIGTRAVQCDATAVRTAPDGARAYVLLDGIGTSEAIRAWTRAAARSLALAACRQGDAEAGLRRVYRRFADDPDRYGPHKLPGAAAVVAVTAPGKPLTVAWCGDSRAYLVGQGAIARRLTDDHNLRRVWPPTAMAEGGNRNTITSYLGAIEDAAERMDCFGHPEIESTAVPLDRPARLVLASDGAYEPCEAARYCLDTELGYTPLTPTAREFVHLAIETAHDLAPAGTRTAAIADNATVLLADLPRPDLPRPDLA